MTKFTGLKYFFGIAPIAALAVGAAGCSTLKGGKSGQELSSNGPSIVAVKTNPDTIELNMNGSPNGPAEVIAEVKDFTSAVSDVRLRFIRVPMEVQMQHVQGTTWRAELSPEQLRTLAVGGETMRYDANVIARNQDGQTTVSREPVTVAVKSPEVGKSQTG